MKKLTLLFALVITLFTFTGCEKDDEIKLSGTKWVATISEGEISISATLNFKDSKNVDVISSYASVSQTYSGTYTYAHPTIEITVDGETEEFTVVDSKHITVTDEDGVTITFTKK